MSEENILMSVHTTLNTYDISKGELIESNKKNTIRGYFLNGEILYNKSDIEKYIAIRSIKKDEKNKNMKEKRNYPTVSFSLTQDDKRKLDSITLEMVNKKSRVLTQSEVIRAMINLAYEHEDEIGNFIED